MSNIGKLINNRSFNPIITDISYTTLKEYETNAKSINIENGFIVSVPQDSDGNDLIDNASIWMTDENGLLLNITKPYKMINDLIVNINTKIDTLVIPPNSSSNSESNNESNSESNNESNSESNNESNPETNNNTEQIPITYFWVYSKMWKEISSGDLPFTYRFTNWNQGNTSSFSNKPLNVTIVKVGLQRECRFNKNHYVKLTTKYGKTATYHPTGYYNKGSNSTVSTYNVSSISNVPNDVITSIEIHDQSASVNENHAWQIWIGTK